MNWASRSWNAAFGPAFHDLEAQFIFQIPYGIADIGAGQIETFRCLGYGSCFINSQGMLNLLYFHQYHLAFLNNLHKKYTSL